MCKVCILFIHIDAPSTWRSWSSTSCKRPNRTSLKYSDKVHQECHSLKVPECTRYQATFESNSCTWWFLWSQSVRSVFSGWSTSIRVVHSYVHNKYSDPLQTFVGAQFWMENYTAVGCGWFHRGHAWSASGSIVPRSRKVWVAHKVRMVDPQPILFLAGSFGYCWCQKCWLDVAISGWS